MPTSHAEASKRNNESATSAVTTSRFVRIVHLLKAREKRLSWLETTRVNSFEYTFRRA